MYVMLLLLQVHENGSCDDFTEVYFDVVQEGKAVKQNAAQLLARVRHFQHFYPCQRLHQGL